MTETAIFYKKLEPVQVAFIKTRVDTRDQIPPLFERLRLVCGEYISGKAMAIFHSGAVKDGLIVEAAYPVTCTVEMDEVHTRMLESAPALMMFHYGEHNAVRKTIRTIYDYQRAHAWTISGLHREIYSVVDKQQPEKNITEVQLILHEWDRLLAEGTEEVLGTYARWNIMQGIESITPNSSFEEYSNWIKGAIDRLDTLTKDDEKKCQVVSHCAHVFPQERIDHLRLIYETGEFDDILREMYRDDFWYEKPVRRGNVIYMCKNPFDPEGYANADTASERRKAYCHCRFVHPYLDGTGITLSPTFCFCGAGWYRRLWEGILGQPVKIEHVETLLRGNDQCTMTITLPMELSGECSPVGERSCERSPER